MRRVRRPGLSRLMEIAIFLTLGVIAIVVAASVYGVVDIRLESLIRLFDPGNIIPGFGGGG